MTTPRRAWIAFLLAVALAAPPLALSAESTTEEQVTALVSALKRGSQALDEEDYEKAAAAFGEVVENPRFELLAEDEQSLVLYLLAIATEGLKDYLGAHELIVLATDTPTADSEAWLTRARLSFRLQNWPDAGLAIETVARRWPKALADVKSSAVMRTAYRLRADHASRGTYLALAQALFEAGFRLDWGAEPDALWQDLALQVLERGDLAAARKIAGRITTPDRLARIRADRRFDKLVAAEPRAFDVAAAAASECRRWRGLVRQHPRSLDVRVQYVYRLMMAGDFQQALDVTEESIAAHSRGAPGKPSFDDADDTLNWIHDVRSDALRGLGRFDEALQAMQAASLLRESSGDKASQAINLGYAFISRQRPEDAMRALDGVDWAKALSPYGRTQLQYVRFRANLQLGKREAAEEIYAWLRENHGEASNVWQRAMLHWGDLDGAAADLIVRLRDPWQREDALYEVQHFRPIPLLPQEEEDLRMWEALLAREDVAAAIAEVGRRDRLPIYHIF